MNFFKGNFAKMWRDPQVYSMPWASLEAQFAPHTDADRPQWDPATGRLMLCGKIIRQLPKRARNCIAVLTAFEEEGWPPYIDDPLPGGKNAVRLNNTVRTLNTRKSAIRFRAGGDGESIRWERKK